MDTYTYIVIFDTLVSFLGVRPCGQICVVRSRINLLSVRKNPLTQDKDVSMCLKTYMPSSGVQHRGRSKQATMNCSVLFLNLDANP